MVKLVPIAFRNVFRNTRRTALTLLVIGFGVAALVLAGGFFAYNFEGLRETTIRNGLGHLQIFNARYLEEGEEKPLEQGIEDYPALQAWLEAQPRVKATTAQVDFVGLISNGDKSEAFIGSGIDPGREFAMGFGFSLKEGEPLSPEGEAQILLGTGLAASLKAKLGDVLTLMGTTQHGALNALDVRVSGFFSTGIKEFDARAVKVALSTAQSLLATTRATKVIVRLDATRHTDEMAATLLAAGFGGREGLRVKTWFDLATFYKQVVLLYETIFVFLGSIIVILVVLSTGNTMMMSVLERVREIGTLLALGTRRRHVVAIFVLEGLFIGLLGGALGLLGSWGLIKWINASGIMMPPPPSFSRGIPLQVNVVPELFAGVFALTALLMVVSALAPALRGARLRIVEALGHV